MFGPHGALILASLAVLVHATLCAIQHRDYLKGTDQAFVYSPIEVTLQCVAAVLLGTWGVLGVQGSFLPIRTTEVLGRQYASGPGCSNAHPSFPTHIVPRVAQNLLLTHQCLLRAFAGPSTTSSLGPTSCTSTRVSCDRPVHPCTAMQTRVHSPSSLRSCDCRGLSHTVRRAHMAELALQTRMRSPSIVCARCAHVTAMTSHIRYAELGMLVDRCMLNRIRTENTRVTRHTDTSPMCDVVTSLTLSTPHRRPRGARTSARPRAHDARTCRAARPLEKRPQLEARGTQKF
jgi:hypothetical protein